MAAEPTPGIRDRRAPIGPMIAIGLVASVLGVALGLLIDWFPVAASGEAKDIDTLWDVLIIASVPVFVLVQTIVLYSVWKFRMRPGEELQDGPPIHGNTKLEVFWVTVPFIMVTLLAIYGWYTLDNIEAKQQNEMVVNVTGQQFTWTFEYPQQKVQTKELVLPVNRAIEFKIKTKDVLHSFWVPQFRLKSDAVPGLTTKIRLTPDREGNYEVVCAELCGLGHSAMRQFVRVVPTGEFQKWLDQQKQAAGGGGGTSGGGTSGGGGGGGGQAASGEEIFTSAGCSGCHTLAAAGSTAKVGPDLGKLGDEANADFIRKSIADPNAEITKGYKPDIMPQNFGDQLSKEELDALVKYLLESQE
jgi:cytochrome c oxidase subunit 2